MTAREQLVMSAVRAIAETYGDHVELDYSNLSESDVQLATAVVNAVLPQITTEAELDALEAECRQAKLVDQEGAIYGAWMAAARVALVVSGPLTVVWKR